MDKLELLMKLLGEEKEDLEKGPGFVNADPGNQEARCTKCGKKCEACSAHFA